MRETPDDLRRLDRLLEASATAGGSHLRSIITDDRRLTAAEVAEKLPGMRLLALATVTAAGAPLVSPVDGIFYRGEFWFGSSPDSVKLRHIATRPAVSATHLPGEELAVTVHGTASVVDLDDDEHAGFRDVCTEIYGEGWLEWGSEAAYARIEARRMFTFWLPLDHPDRAAAEG